MEQIKWEDIVKVNNEIKTTKLPAKKKNDRGGWDVVYNDYVEVKERVIAFRKLYPQGNIYVTTEYQEKYIVAKAEIYSKSGCSHESLMATGHARELITKDFALENAETSAIGRALGFCGLGIDASIASAEEIENTESPSGVFDEPINRSLKGLAEEFRKLYTVEEQARILNGLHYTRAEDIGMADLEKYINFKKYGKKQTDQG